MVWQYLCSHLNQLHENPLFHNFLLIKFTQVYVTTLSPFNHTINSCLYKWQKPGECCNIGWIDIPFSRSVLRAPEVVQRTNPATTTDLNRNSSYAKDLYLEPGPTSPSWWGCFAGQPCKKKQMKYHTMPTKQIATKRLDIVDLLPRYISLCATCGSFYSYLTWPQQRKHSKIHIHSSSSMLT